MPSNCIGTLAKKYSNLNLCTHYFILPGSITIGFKYFINAEQLDAQHFCWILYIICTKTGYLPSTNFS